MRSKFTPFEFINPMKNIFLGVVFIFFSTAVSAAPPLIGKWQSDRERTMSFIKQNMRLEKKTFKFLAEMMGRLSLTFTSDRLSVSIPNWDVEINGKIHHMTGLEDESPYSVLFSNENLIVLKSVDPVTRKPMVSVYNFDGPDLMWVYTGGADKALPDFHSREYFRRVNQDSLVQPEYSEP